MKKILIAGLMVAAMAGVVRADEPINAPEVIETGFQRYVVNPVQWVHRFTWGVLSVAYRVGKAPVDAGFKIVGQTLGTEPNTPLWE